MESMMRRMRGTSTPNSSISLFAGFEAFIMRDNAVPNVTSSAKFTWPLARKAATSAPAVLMDGRIGNIGFLQACIFSCSTSYISNMVTNPGVPKIAITASTLSNFSSQYSKQSRRCSGVPVAKISIGLPTAAPGKSLLFSSSASSPSSFGTFSPPLLKASVSITPGPPAWVIMAKFFPFSSGKVKIHPTVVSSSRE